MFTVRQIERLPTSSGDVPKEPVVITKSGVLEAADPFLTTDNIPADGDKYEDFPEDGDDDVQNPEIALTVAKNIRELGNKLFKEGNPRGALLKYQSTYLGCVPSVRQPLNTELQNHSDTSTFTPSCQKSLLPLCRNHTMPYWHHCF